MIISEKNSEIIYLTQLNYTKDFTYMFLNVDIFMG